MTIICYNIIIRGGIVMYKNEFKRIIEASRKNSLTFFVGAGISALSNAPRWSDMIDQICDFLKIERKNKYSADDYLQIPQIFYNEINKDNEKYYSFLNKCLNANRLVPNDIHKLLYKFKPSSIITTNFDDLLEESAANACYNMKVAASDTEISDINGERFILKVHGDFKHRNIVFKEEDYLSYSDNFKLIETILKSVFSTNTVVFVGYGLNDYNIKLILNWSKNLLKDKFNKPIFIYTDDLPLTDSQLKYHVSRGLSVIDFHKYLCEQEYKDNYFIRYKTVLEEILKHSDIKPENNDKFEFFDFVHKSLLPLKNVSALKPDHIQEKLIPHIAIEETGRIFSLHNNYNILEYFYEIYNMSEDEKSKLERNVLLKYNDIMMVFNKALMFVPTSDASFGDLNCILLDYSAMQKYVNKKYTSITSNYCKAFYLAKLSKYQESYDLFSEVAIQAFKSNEHWIFYLSQINKNNVYYALRGLKRNILYSNSVDENKSEKVEIDFYNFPIEFQNDYNVFQELYSSSWVLYNNFYDSFVEGRKLDGRIDASSSGTSISYRISKQIHNNIHFILGNHLLLDDFSEFKDSIKYLMPLLLKIYSQKNKRPKIDSMQNIFGKEEVRFSIIEFYCLINCYESKELRKTLKDLKIEEIYFENVAEIEKAIINIIKYYDKYLSSFNNGIEKSSIEHKIKNCLEVLKYMTVSQSVIDSICKFIFKYEFREILIDDKVYFISNQLGKRKMYSSITKKVIKSRFFAYFDENILCAQKNEQYHIYSSTGVFYDHLIHYIRDDKEEVDCLGLAKRINIILKNNYIKFHNSIFTHYYNYLSSSQKKMVRAWGTSQLSMNFDFSLFSNLLDEEYTVSNASIIQLKQYLVKKYFTIEKNNNTFIQVGVDQNSELINVGYWCFTDLLPHEPFKEFVGICTEYDFFYLYDKFDFEKFDVSFIMNKREHVYRKLSENIVVKEHIRNRIIKSLKNKELHYKDEEQLQTILINYFC